MVADALVLAITWAATFRTARARRTAGLDLTFSSLLLRDGELPIAYPLGEHARLMLTLRDDLLHVSRVCSYESSTPSALEPRVLLLLNMLHLTFTMLSVRTMISILEEGSNKGGELDGAHKFPAQLHHTVHGAVRPLPSFSCFAQSLGLIVSFLQHYRYPRLALPSRPPRGQPKHRVRQRIRHHIGDGVANGHDCVRKGRGIARVYARIARYLIRLVGATAITISKAAQFGRYCT